MFTLQFLATLDYYLIPLSLILVIFLTTKYTWLSPTSNRNNRSPPSPPTLPIIGNLHQLGNFPHRSLRSLSERYGELMLLHFGSKPTLVVSSPDIAKQILQTHDITFSNRPNLRFVNQIFYGGKEIGFMSYSEEWRRMKSIAVTNHLSNKKVQSFCGIREEEVGLMVENIRKNDGSPFNLTQMLYKVASDIACRTTLGRKYGLDDDLGLDFQPLFKEMVEVMGEISVGDFIPWLGWIDWIKGLPNRAERVRKSFDDFLHKVIEEHVNALDRQAIGVAAENEEKFINFVDVLLQIQREDATILSRDNFYGLIIDMFAPSIETIQTSLEWTMTEVLRNPQVMKQLQKEVRQIAKENNRVTEDDLKNMYYLKAVIKETLRLHPPSPLLIFRESSQDVEINGYKIVAGTLVIINAWAIQRNAQVWDDPEIFKPERFLSNSSVDFMGQHFEYIPFGAGRRSCPGIPYGLATVELVIASLVYHFDWKLPRGVELESLNVKERVGITVHPRDPISVAATPFVSK